MVIPVTKFHTLTEVLSPAIMMVVPGVLQVYVHHYVSSSKFILGNGAELRGSFTREPLPEPYSLVVDTEDLKEDLIRRALLPGNILFTVILCFCLLDSLARWKRSCWGWVNQQGC